uniref:Uncharacterized protein n=1 Tax=Tanacetum cinerariifolium TaxID=118510 RepID=A0A6L2JSC8_TANCI|nr:hypothetical protein [Tanacetum cinerariifolium]
MVKHIEKFLKIGDSLNVLNVSHDRLRVSIFHVSLVGAAFEEFNYLLEIDADVLTKDIPGLKTYGEYKDDCIYEWNDKIPWVHKKPWMADGVWKEPTAVKHDCKPFCIKSGYFEWPTCNWRDKGYCNGGNFPGAFQDVQDEMKLNKDEDDDVGHLDYLVHGNAPFIINKEEERSKERRCKLLGISLTKPPACKMERFEVVKCSFGPSEKYVAIKECGYYD